MTKNFTYVLLREEQIFIALTTLSVNYTKAVQKYIKKYRQSINPPYTGKDYLVLGITFLILLAIPSALFLTQHQTSVQQYAAMPTISPAVLQQHIVINGKELTLPFAATDPNLVSKGAKGGPHEKHGLGLVLEAQPLSATNNGHGGKPTPKPTSIPTPSFTPSPTITPGGPTQSPSPTTLPTPTNLPTITPTPLNYPTTVDLSMYDTPIGDQGGVGSCVSWATGYNERGWYARRDGYYPPGGSGSTGSWEPMYLYSQLVNGQNAGTTFSGNYSIEQQQGIDTREDYTQGDYDYTDLPTTSEKTNAANFKIKSYAPVSYNQAGIEAALSAGRPVVIGIPVYSNFYSANASTCLVDVPPSGSTLYGTHAVMVVKYDQNGAWIENQWGTSWGCNGYAELTWNFVNHYVFAGYQANPNVPTVTYPPYISPTPLPNTPSVSINAPGCITGPVTGTNTLTISWTDPTVTAVYLSGSGVNVGKGVPAGTLSTQAPIGFPSTAVLNPNYTYQAFTYNGVLSAKTPFTIPLCPTATP